MKDKKSHRPIDATILVIDDNSSNVDLLSKMLAAQGYKVRPSTNARFALQSALSNPPDLVLLDIKMPDMDGITLCRELKRDPRTSDVPVIFISALHEIEDKIKAFEAGGVDYLTKPFHDAEVLLRVRTQLNLFRMQTRLEQLVQDRTAELTSANEALREEIIERTRAEDALRHQAFLLENVSDAIISTDVNFVIQSWNQAAEEMYGWSAGKVIGRHFGEVAQPEYPDDERDEVIEQLRADGFWEGEVIHKHKDGTSIHILGSVTLLKDNAGNPVGIVSANRDITERKRLEKELRQHERLAAVGQLAAGIAHDFRNLLTTTILYANMGLYIPDLPPKLAQNLKTIIGESQKAANLVQQILDFSSRAMIRVQALDLESFIEEISDILRRTIPENIHLVLETRPETSAASFTVEADPTRIQQVLMNLATNARDAMPDGGELCFKLSRIELGPDDEPPVADMQPGEWVCLAVSDTGTGMTEDVRAHLFEPFFTTKKVGKGTGLGLAQVYGIVRQHEGYVGVETEVGEGTTFRIYLLAATAETKVVEKKTSSVPRGQGETILLVEDNEKLREAGQGALESLGYQVLVATNGREALEVYQMESEVHPGRRFAPSQKVDLIITDMVMPEMGGRELVQELRRTVPNLKAIGVTGYAAEKIAAELRDAGFLAVVRKPFDIETLMRVIRRVLDVQD